MSFANAPVTRGLVVGLVTTSVAASLFDIKHYFYILVDTHIWQYHQTWRVLLYQLCYTNASEVLFASMTLYRLRIIERMWGSRKYAVGPPTRPELASDRGGYMASCNSSANVYVAFQSFLLVAALFTTILPPAILALFLRPVTVGHFNYLPAGPTPLIFAILAQYHAIIPHVYKYRLAFSASPPTNDEFVGLTFSDKSYGYALALQLALMQWPGSLLGALVGWAVGYSWRNDLLPGTLTRWRVPGWLVGAGIQKRSAEFEGLRRRLEEEASATATATATATDVQDQAGADAGRRRTFGQQILEQFRGAL